jgi:TonB family protein
MALLGHGAVVAGALVGTLRPTDPPHAIRAVLMPWREPAARTTPIGARVPPPPVEDPVQVPVEVQTDLPPIVGSRPFDATEWTPCPHVTLPGDTLTDGGNPWTSEVVDEPPALLAGRAPTYPEVLRAAGIAGRVVVEAVIDTLGHAEAAVRVVERSHSGFEAPALDYIRRATFRPGRVHGRAVRVLIRLPVDFRLTGVQ